MKRLMGEICQKLAGTNADHAGATCSPPRGHAGPLENAFAPFVHACNLSASVRAKIDEHQYKTKRADVACLIVNSCIRSPHGMTCRRPASPQVGQEKARWIGSEVWRANSGEDGIRNAVLRTLQKAWTSLPCEVREQSKTGRGAVRTATPDPFAGETPRGLERRTDVAGESVCRSPHLNPTSA